MDAFYPGVHGLNDWISCVASYSREMREGKVPIPTGNVPADRGRSLDTGFSGPRIWQDHIRLERHVQVHRSSQVRNRMFRGSLGTDLHAPERKFWVGP